MIKIELYKNSPKWLQKRMEDPIGKEQEIETTNRKTMWSSF